MATNFPTSLDNLTNPVSTDQLNSPSHSAQHANINDAVEALEAKVGVNSSAITTSHDYKIAQLEAAISVQNTNANYIPLNVLGQPQGPAELDIDGNLLIPKSSIIFEGSSADSYETTLTVTNPTADRTLTLPDITGTIALTSDISTAISNLVNSAPSTLDTLSEIATALGNDANLSTTLTNSLALKAPLASPTFTGTVTLPANTVTNTMLAGSITNAKLLNSSITINGSSVSLGGSVSITGLPTQTGNVGKYLTTDGTNPSWATIDLSAYAPIASPTFTGTVILPNNTVTNGMLAGSISNDKLANSSITINNFPISLGGAAAFGTDNIGEGTTNLYFTNERAQDAIGNYLGSGLSYNDGTGAISVDTTTIQSRVTDVSDTEIGYLNGVTSGIQAQIDSKLSSTTASSTYSPINSPTFTGTPLAPTATAGTNTTQVATTEFVKTAVNNLVASAPGALDTLNELAAALGNDANFSTTITNSLALKAPLASPTFTGTVSGITKSMVGLSNVDNTSDVNKPISTATQSALDLKAALSSPTFTGTPAAPTATSGTNTTQIATTAFVKTAIDSSVQPGALYQTSAPTNPAVGQIWVDSDDDMQAFDLTYKKTEIPTSISANTNLEAGKRYFVTSASALTLTLPVSPTLNDEIQILDASGNASTYNITVSRNGNKINGGTGNLIIDTSGGWYNLVYTGSTYGWKVG